MGSDGLCFAHIPLEKAVTFREVTVRVDGDEDAGSA